MHTPGPWTKEAYFVSKIDPDGRQTANDGNSVARCYGPDAEINARLIAAAPELLDALQGLLADVEDYQRINNLGGEDNHWQVIARAAIAKATQS